MWRSQSGSRIQLKNRTPNRRASEIPAAIGFRTTLPSFAVYLRPCLFPWATVHAFYPEFRNAFRAVPEIKSIRQYHDWASDADCYPVSLCLLPGRELIWSNSLTLYL